MKVLVINCGSSSLKFRLIETDKEDVIAKGLCERIGSESAHFVYEPAGGEKYETDTSIPDHDEAVRILIEALTDEEFGVIKDVSEIEAVGHRIVHGGDKFDHAEYLTPEVVRDIEACCELAPIHNPVNLMGIRACMKVMPDTHMVGVFDTAFHHSLPEEAYLYGIPYEYYKKYRIRRYGFHGMSHKYVSKETARMLGVPYDHCKTIVCHLGNGASITAVKNGYSVDTSMGYTPLEGIIMGTRCGSIDPEIIHIITEKDGARWGVQVKRYSGLVKASAVRQVVTGLKMYGCDRAMVVTNSTYSATARRLAAGNDCVLIDGRGLARLSAKL